MKKSIFLLGMAVAALASCTNEEVTQVAESNVIKFEPFVGKTTKSLPVTEVDNESIKNFYVFATKDANNSFFNNEKVYESSTENVWVYDDLKQWEAKEHKFAAYSNGGTDGKDGKIENATWDGTKLSFSDYSVNYSDQRDLVASISATNLSTYNQPVTFNFSHTLAMIKFTLKSTLGDDDNKITITDFKVNGAKNKATLDFNSSSATWTTPSDNVELTHKDSNAFEVTTTAPGESDEFIVIPQTATLTITFKATISGLQEKTLKATISNTKWDPGFRYNYVATIDGSSMDVIEFADPTVKDWDDTSWDTGINTDNNGEVISNN